MDHRTLAGAGLLLILTLLVAACGGGKDDEAVPRQDIMAVVNEHATALIQIEGVEAVAVGELASGEPCIRVYTSVPPAELQGRIPASLGGHPVQVQEGGKFEPLGDQ